MPFILKEEPEVLYSNKKQIVEHIKENSDLPTIYFFNADNNRFLDDILLFSITKESYIAKNHYNIDEILKEKNTENGLIIFINEGQENDIILEKVKQYTNLTEYKHLERLNACDVYIVK